MLTCDVRELWTQFIESAKARCSKTTFGNWLAPIKVLDATSEKIVLEIPNLFVKEYLLSNFKQELASFLPLDSQGEPVIEFRIKSPEAPVIQRDTTVQPTKTPEKAPLFSTKLNNNYRFETFIEGPTNQFVKSAAIGVASRPGNSYNPVVIHGGVGLGKTHILHSIGHYIRETQPKLRVQCITTEEFINTLVDHLRNKSVDRLKQFYRAEVDVLLVDDIQFLQNRLNFEEEFSNMFEALVNQSKQIVITSDKPPAQLKLSERFIARMEWGLVAHLGVPELETRVAILQNKARQRGLEMSNEIAFFIAEHVYHNIRQLEGAVNRLSAHCRLLNLQLTQELVWRLLGELFQSAPGQRVTVEQILKSVGAVFQVSVNDLRSTVRTKNVALPRQIAMYLACKLVKDSLQMLGTYFKKTHSTILYACKEIEKKIAQDELLRRQVQMVERNLSLQT